MPSEDQYVVYPSGAHPDRLGGRPWFRIREGLVYPAFGHPDGERADPWFEILSGYWYTALSHPAGARPGAWFRMDGETIWTERGNPDWSGTPEPWYALEKPGAGATAGTPFGPRPSHPVQNPLVRIAHRGTDAVDENGSLFEVNAGRASPEITTDVQIVKLYDDLRLLMKEHGLFSSATKVNGRYPPRLVPREFHELCAGLIEMVQRRVPRLEGQLMILDASRIEQLNDRLLRHALVFSETTLLVTPGIRGEVWGTEDHAVDYWIPQSFITVIGQYWHLIRDGFILPLPENVRSAGLGRDIVHAEATTGSPQRGDVLRYAADGLGDRDLVFAAHGRVMVPSLTRMRVNSILKMRDAEHSSFKRFHVALRGLIRSEGLGSDPDSLVTAVRYTDQMVVDLDERIRALRPVGAVAGGVLAAGLAALALPVDARWIVPALTGIAATGFKFYTDTYQQFKALHRDPFYFPWWLAHRKPWDPR
jgi:hypothetical protein